MKKASFLLALVLVFTTVALMLTACMKGAPDDAYMIDLTDKRDVTINNSIAHVVMGDFESFRLFEQLILEEFSDGFNSEIPNVGKIEHGDKEKAKKAAEFFLKEYFGTRYIDPGGILNAFAWPLTVYRKQRVFIVYCVDYQGI